ASRPPVPEAQPTQPTPAPSLPSPSRVQGKIAMWDIYYPDITTRHPLGRLSEFTRRYEVGLNSATVGVGVGPAVTGLDDLEYKKWEKLEIRQVLLNGLDKAMDFGSVKPTINDREQTSNGFVYHEMFIDGRGADRGKRTALLTGMQDGFAVHYWFAGASRLYPAWKRDVIGKAILE
ncbi:unnamed protein product, partial [Ectocarpus fasciculatus]